MDNDAARHQMEDVLALVQEQMADLATLQKRQASLTAIGTAADGTVEVTVDSRGAVIKTVIDESYLEEFEFDALGDHITAAAKEAAATVGRRAAELIMPLTERRKMFPSLADIVDGAPDIGAMFDNLAPDLSPVAETPPDDTEDPDAVYRPTVRR